MGKESMRPKINLRRDNTDPTPPRLRPTVASLPNHSLLAIAYKGGELLPHKVARA